MKTPDYIVLFVIVIHTILMGDAYANIHVVVEEVPVHLKIKRMNDTYIDAFHNPPSGKAKQPIVLFCQGSGYDSNTQGILSLLKLYEDKAVGLAIEKEGVVLGDRGDILSQRYREQNTIHNRLYDYLRVLQYLKAHADWWNGEVYVIGGSEGGLLAGMIASYYPNVRAAGILSYGGGLNFGEAWPVARGLQLKAEGASHDEVKKVEAIVSDSLSFIRQNSTYTKSYSGDDNTYAWWASILDLRLENTLLDLNIPIIVVQGADDVMAPPQSARKLYNTFQNAGKDNLVYKEYEGYDHAFIDDDGNSHLVEVFMSTIDWLLAN